MSIILKGLTKRYDGVAVVNNVSMQVADGEFFVLLGSSGSGKTTVLSMIAGLTPIDQGRVLLHGRDVTYLPTQERRVGFVFQHYALFEHMTVAENVEFGLRVRRVSKVERRRRRDELLELVGLAGLGGRLPRQISGGQQQRVALARALAHQPDVLLLDEPLGALDARIRAELRRTLRAIQRELGIATILVTHDQEEAFELADRLGVMSFGRLLEVGEPQALYRHPQTEFVATFLGTANLLVGQTTENGIQAGPYKLPLNGARRERSGNGRVQVLFRPEDVVLAAQPETLDCAELGRALVEETIFSGSYERLRLRLRPASAVRSISPPLLYGEGSLVVEAMRTQEQASALPLRAGEHIWVGVKNIHALDHPGLQFLVLYDGTPAAQAALASAGQISRLAHARVTLLACGLETQVTEQQVQQAKEQLGSGVAALDTRVVHAPAVEAARRELERKTYDLVILGMTTTRDLSLAQALLQTGEHHLLFVPGPQPVPRHALVCVATGEPGKTDVFFAGRLVRHLEAEATLLAVLPAGDDERMMSHSAQRFLEDGARTLELLGVGARTVVRRGPVASEIVSEMKGGTYDLLVLGAPLSERDGVVSFSGVVHEVMQEVREHPVLIVRYEAPLRHEAGAEQRSQVRMMKEVVE